MATNSERHNHILNTSSNLLGICFVLITGLKVTNKDADTYVDELCFFAAFILLASCLFSYLSIRNEKSRFPFEHCADYCFLFSIISLFVALTIYVVGW